MQHSKLFRIVTLVVLLASFTIALVPAAAQEDVVQRNKDAVIEAFAQYSAGNVEGFVQLTAETFMMNQGEASLAEMTREDVMGFSSAIANAIPDLQAVPVVLIGQGDWIAVEVSYSGTFSAPFVFEFISPDPIPPTDESVAWTEMDFMHFNEDGLVDELWTISDPTVMFSQLGVMPPTDEGQDSMEISTTPPAEYEPLSEDELAATFISGQEERNTGIAEAILEQDMTMSTAAFYTNPYFSHEVDQVHAVDPTQEEDPLFMAVTGAMPDLTRAYEVVVAEGDWVATLITLNGTFTEEVNLGPEMTLPPTGETVSWQVSFIDRYDADGLITEEWFEFDPTPLLTGLGLMPPMGEEQ